MFSIFLYIILCNWIFALHEANHLFIYLLSPTTLPIIEWFLSFSRMRKKRSSQLSISIWFFPLENNNNVMNDENSLMFKNLFFTQTRGKSGYQKIIVCLDFFLQKNVRIKYRNLLYYCLNLNLLCGCYCVLFGLTLSWL